MRTMLLRLGTFVIVAFFAVGMFAQVDNKDYNLGGGGGGGGDCWICYGTYNFDTHISNGWCGSPDAGGWGSVYCDTEIYEGSGICQTAGGGCCVD